MYAVFRGLAEGPARCVRGVRAGAVCPPRTRRPARPQLGLGIALVETGGAPCGGRSTIRQGVEMGRPSTLLRARRGGRHRSSGPCATSRGEGHARPVGYPGVTPGAPYGGGGRRRADGRGCLRSSCTVATGTSLPCRCAREELGGSISHLDALELSAPVVRAAAGHPSGCSGSSGTRSPTATAPALRARVVVTDATLRVTGLLVERPVEPPVELKRLLTVASERHLPEVRHLGTFVQGYAGGDRRSWPGTTTHCSSAAAGACSR